MPRDGTGNYNQPFPNVAPDTTIESVVYNGFVQDVALDLNAARPIIAGGTGAASADDALLNIGGEKASQLVTNYDSHIWQAGSFYSSVGATGAPIEGYGISGICCVFDNDHITLEARQYIAGITSPVKYVRQKVSGTWSAWISQDPAGGGTVIGDITISKAAPFLKLDATTVSEPVIQGQRSGVTRWGMSFASLEPEAGGNAGSDWYLAAFSDAGSYIHTALYADRATGLVTVNGNPTAALGIATKQMVDLKAPIASPDFTGDIKSNGVAVLSYSSDYSRFYNPSGIGYGMLIGNTDAANYYRNTTHYIQSRDGGTGYMTLGPSVNTSHLEMYVPTATAAENSTRVATTAWVRGYAQPADPQLFAGIPPVAKGSGSGTVLTDSQKMILATGTVTIDGAVHPVGTCLSFFANGGTLAIGNTETMYYNLGGSGLTGSRSLSSLGVATAVKFSSSQWVISGNGLT